MAEDREIILASGSETRVRLLDAAGVAFRIEPSDVDERAIREALAADNEIIDPNDIAEVLARAKAEQISQRNPDAIVIGADQILALGTEIITKTATIDQARDVLMRLRGRAHQLCSAVVIAEAGETTWADVQTASITMRNYSAAFLAHYLAIAGPRVLGSVGCYHMEGPGVQLFEAVEGDYFTVLGLPLLPLLAELRDRRMLPT